MTARGSWPFAFLYQLHDSLINLLPSVMAVMKPVSVSVVCPVCNTFDMDMSEAREAAASGGAVNCWWCKHHRGATQSIDVSGFVSWDDGVVDSEDGSLVDAALEFARLQVEKKSKAWPIHVKHARDKLIK